MEGNGRQWKAVEGSGRQWKAVEGSGRQWKAVEGSGRVFRRVLVKIDGIIRRQCKGNDRVEGREYTRMGGGEASGENRGKR
jgi:hypothetical protein